MGCAGHPFLKTPTMDRLAAQGVRFSNMIVTISICATSRATAMFGRLMTVNVAGTTQPFEELFGPRLKQFRFQHPLWLLQDWREVFDSAAIVQTGEVDGEKVFVLKLSAKGVPTHTLQVSAESGLVLKEQTVEIALGVGQLPLAYTYTDYRAVDGVMLPFKIVAKSLQSGEIFTQFESAISLDELNDDEFRLTPPSD